MNLKTYIEKKGESYANIDIKRMLQIWQEFGGSFVLPRVIQIVGTNGKGSTGRFLATMLKNLGFRVGHYTSPHITSFNERIWIDGKNITDEALESTHIWLQDLLKKRASSLSYFEYTTLLALRLFGELDFAILEAGLGGEYDATTVVPKEMSLFTPIGYDHQQILGDTIEKIATTKLKSMASVAIIGAQEHSKVIEIAKKIAEEKGTKLYLCDELLDSEQRSEVVLYIAKNGMPNYQVENLSLAASALKLLGFEFKTSLADGFFIAGRCQKIAHNITIDVGHNLLSAKRILDEFYGKKMVLVYNTLLDKDFKAIIKTLKPIIKRVEIIAIKNPRAIDYTLLEQELRSMGLEVAGFKEIKRSEEYLVYGSFSVVEEFCSKYTRVPLCEIDT